MPRKRNSENKGLPARWKSHHGAYYYNVPPGLESLWDGFKMFRLGSSLPEAYAVWADKLGRIDKAQTIAELLDRYALQVIPTKAPRTQVDNYKQVERLRSVFGALPIDGVKPQFIYQYMDKRTAKVAGKREMALLSHALTKAVEWGYIDRHPFKGEVRLKGEAPRTRYIEDWEIIECLSIVPTRKRGSVLMIQAYIRVKLLTGLRRSDLLKLSPAKHFKADGIHITTSKTKRSVIYSWSDELREAIDMALAARPIDIGSYLFCTKTGECYVTANGTASAWESMWQRFMTRIMTETTVVQRFTEHDLRAKCASDALTLNHAMQLLTHADSKITDRVYRRKPAIVKPLR